MTDYYRLTRFEDDDEIASDLMNIISMGYNVIGITTDGGDNIIRTVEYVYSDVPRQRFMSLVIRNHTRVNSSFTIEIYRHYIIA